VRQVCETIFQDTQEEGQRAVEIDGLEYLARVLYPLTTPELAGRN
jgi:hypothetical protein